MLSIYFLSSGFFYGRFNANNKLDLVEIYFNGIEFHQLVREELLHFIL